MRPTFNKTAVTLIELLIGLVLISLVVLSVGNIEMFCRYSLVHADKKAKVDNDLFYVIEHMSKKIMMGVGDIQNPPVQPNPFGSGTEGFILHVDNSTPFPNGIWEPTNDKSIAYQWTGKTCTESGNDCSYQVRYYDNYVSPSSTSERLARNVYGFNVVIDTADNSTMNINLTGCWNPAESNGRKCGSLDNPSVNMTTRVKMFPVSLR
jgi:hypothetical protein